MLRRALQSSSLWGQATQGLQQLASAAPAVSSSNFTLLPGLQAAWSALQHRLATSVTAEGLKFYKPTTPGFRGRVVTARKDLWKGGPFKPLTQGFSRTGGRNHSGKAVARHIGGGSKRIYRIIDFQRSLGTAPGVVERLEYDPNRSAHIALLKLQTRKTHKPLALREQYSYVLAPQGVAPGDTLLSGTDVPIRPGNTLPLSHIPIGMQVHNVELRPGCGGQLARAAGASATLVKKGDNGYAVLRLPSGEQRLVLSRCMATIGVLSNPQNKNSKLGKAGATRWLGRRPRVRGMAMNCVDHPHGGGRGKKKGRISQTPWGKPTKGYRTRRNPTTDRFIRESRHKARGARG